MDVVSIFVRLWVAISMVLLLNMDISRAISRLSRPLLIIMINLISIRSMIMITVLVNIGVSMSMEIAISLNSLGTSVIVAYARGVTISRLSISLVVTSITISLNTLGTSVVITDT